MSEVRTRIEKLEVKFNYWVKANPNDYIQTRKVYEDNLDVTDKKLIEQAEHVKSILKLGDEEEIFRNILEWVKIYEIREQVRDLMIEHLIINLNNSIEVIKYLFMIIVGIGLLTPLLILAYKTIRHFYKP